MDAAARTRWISERARALGFDLCGVAPAAEFPELEQLPEWLARGYAGEMRYLHDPRRRSPSAALPGAQSIIVCALNYNTGFPYSTDAAAAECSRKLSLNSAPSVPRLPLGTVSESRTAVSSARGWISRYAWGDDYHEVLGKRLDALLAAIRAEFPEPFEARACVDTGPVVERMAAKYAGLGWLGKNTCLINEQLGSWLFLGVILTTLELAPSLPAPGSSSAAPDSPSAPAFSLPAPPDLCGNCRQCLDACPTGALVEPYVLDARRCISYLTIELRGEIPAEFHDALGWHVFGCDICQDVCPYNRHAPATARAEFQPCSFPQQDESWPLESGVNESASQASEPGTRHSSLFTASLEWLASLTASEFQRIFSHSAIKRTKHAGLTRNARLALARIESRNNSY